MNETTVQKLGLILSYYTTALGMQAENMQRAAVGSSMAYTADAFEQQAIAIHNVVCQ